MVTLSKQKKLSKGELSLTSHELKIATEEALFNAGLIERTPNEINTAINDFWVTQSDTVSDLAYKTLHSSNMIPEIPEALVIFQVIV